MPLDPTVAPDLQASIQARAALMPAADPWFAIEPCPLGILRVWEPHVGRLLRANMFLIEGRDRDLLVDSGMGIQSLRRFLDPRLTKPVVHVVSHSHADHVGSSHEFAEDLWMHPAEADVLANPPTDRPLSYDSYDDEKKRQLGEAGFEMSGLIIAALPEPGFDPATWQIQPAVPTRLCGDGDVVDLGDRAFEVIHAPGHSPGSIVLFERETGVLIGTDAIYDGLLIDTLGHSSIPDYIGTMKRLRELPVSVVHGGHRESFGAAKYRKLIDDYLAWRDV